MVGAAKAQQQRCLPRNPVMVVAPQRARNGVNKKVLCRNSQRCPRLCFCSFPQDIVMRFENGIQARLLSLHVRLSCSPQRYTAKHHLAHYFVFYTPDISFAEMSKKLASLWKNVSPKERREILELHSKQVGWHCFSQGCSQQCI